MAGSEDSRGQDATTCAARIRAMGPGDTLIIADSPIPGIPLARVVMIRFDELSHIHRSHPELRSQESLIVETVRSPNCVFRDPRYADTYGLTRQITLRHDLFVSIDLQPNWLRVKSARIHRRSRTQRLLERAKALYGSGGSGDEE